MSHRKNTLVKIERRYTFSVYTATIFSRQIETLEHQGTCKEPGRKLPWRSKPYQANGARSLPKGVINSFIHSFWSGQRAYTSQDLGSDNLALTCLPTSHVPAALRKIVLALLSCVLCELSII